MLGARYYAEHPAVPLYRTVANINIDGVASFDTFRDLVGVGGGFSTLGRMLEEYADSRGLSVSRIASELERSEAFTRSDQLAFAEAGIPSLLILDGLKWDHFDRAQALARLRTWMTFVYHSPFDDLSQPIEMQAVAEHFELLLGFARFVADAGDEPEWRQVRASCGLEGSGTAESADDRLAFC